LEENKIPEEKKAVSKVRKPKDINKPAKKKTHNSKNPRTKDNE
jgi:hypothetical protein